MPQVRGYASPFIVGLNSTCFVSLGADFDFSKVPKGTGKKDGTFHVRYMLPYKVQCLNCGEIMGAGKKFNSRIETVTDRDYLGVRIFRIYFKCAWCSREFTLVTNPDTADYDVEKGVKRMYNYSAELAAEERRAARAAEEAEEEGGTSVDAMRALDARTEEVRGQVETMDALEELQAVKATHAALRPDEIIANIIAAAAAQDASVAEDDDAAAEEEFRQAQKRRAVQGQQGSVQRLVVFSDATSEVAAATPASAASAATAAPKPEPQKAPNATGAPILAARKPRFVVRRKGAQAQPAVCAGGAKRSRAETPAPPPEPAAKPVPSPAPALGGLVAYSSSDSDGGGDA